jgi:uncharacterized protein
VGGSAAHFYFKQKFCRLTLQTHTLSMSYNGFLERNGFSPMVSAMMALAVLFVLYQVGGGVMTILFMLLSGVPFAELMNAISSGNAVEPIRLGQALGQFLFLALPVLVLTSLHTGSTLLSQPNRDFLALTSPNLLPSPALTMGLGVLGVLVMIPALGYIGDVQLVLLYDVFGLRESLAGFYEQQKNLLEKITRVDSPLEFIWVAIIISITPAICEELFFRGYIQRNFSRVLSGAGAVVWTGTLFGLYHINPFQTVPLVLVGVYLAYLRQTSGSLLPSMVAHAVFNFFSLCGMTMVNHAEAFHLSGEMAKKIAGDEPDLTSPLAIFSSLLSLALFVFILQLYRRSLSHSQSETPVRANG